MNTRIRKQKKWLFKKKQAKQGDIFEMTFDRHSSSKVESKHYIPLASLKMNPHSFSQKEIGLEASGDRLNDFPVIQVNGKTIKEKNEEYGSKIDEKGNIYEGGFLNNKFDGYGVYKSVENCLYKGNWKEDLPHGEGIETWPDGSSFKGNYAKGRRHGFGVYKWEDGSYYEGDWNFGCMEGDVF